MNNRERITATLRCEPTDRPPIIRWLGTGCWSQTLIRWKQESGIGDLDLNTYFGYDPGFRSVPVELGPWPHFEEKTLAEDEEYRTYIEWRGITVRNRKDGNSLPDYMATAVQTPEDWELYKTERMTHNPDTRLEKLTGFISECRTQDAPVQVGKYPFGLFGTPRDILCVENLLIAYYDYPEMVADIIRTHLDLWIKLYRRIAAELQIDMVHIWEDMSGKQGSLISMAMVEQFMMPGYDRIAEFCRNHGISAFSVDSDGSTDELFGTMMRHGVNSFFPFEVQASNDIVRFRREHPGISVWGGLDKRALALEKPAIHQELDKAGELFALGGYIAGFDHAVPPDVPWENFRYFMAELMRLAGV